VGAGSTVTFVGVADVITVEVSRVRYATEDGGFAVLDVITDDGEPAVVAGPVAHVHAGDAMEVHGTWKEHPRHGRQFQAVDVRIAEPTTDAALLSLLGGIRHIGATGAAFLLQRHGSDVLAIVDADPHGRLREVPGIGPVRIRGAVVAWREARALRAVRLFLDAHAVPPAVSGRVIRALGADAVDLLTADPYRLTELEGIGFATADALARALGVPPDDPRRMAAGVVYVLKEAERDGHCHLPRAELTERALRLLGADPDGALAELAARGIVVVLDDRVAEARLHAVESRLAARVRALLDDPPVLKTDTLALERPTDGDFVPTDAQWQAVERAFAGRLSILTGGPGVGKCLRGDARVLADDDLVKISSLWLEGATEPVFDGEGWWSEPPPGLTVASIDDDGRMVAAAVTKLYRQRVREMGREIVLRDGSRIVTTKQHRFLAPTGWTNDVVAGDRLCVPGTLPHGRDRLDTELVALLAWQIGEGHEARHERGRRDCARITQKDEAVLERLRELALGVGSRHGIAMGKLSITRAPGRCAYLTIGSAGYRRHLEGLGYAWGRLSREKRIPSYVMRGDAEGVRVFLRELYAAEGHVAQARSRVELTSSSEHLVQQVAVLLRRFGIWMTIRPVRKGATNGTGLKRTSFEGAIGGPSLRRFAESIGIADPRKQDALDRAAQRPSNTNVDVVPVGGLLKDAKAVAGLSRRYFGLSSSYFTTSKEPSREVASRTPERVRAIIDGNAEADHAERVAALTGRAGHRYKEQVFAAFAGRDQARLHDIGDAMDDVIARDAFYAEVVSVSDMPLDEWVYDLTVEPHHNFVAEGMLCHNTATLHTLVEIAVERKLSVKLCAPTGKAARRMAEATGAEATTIHRLLGWQPGEGFVHGPGDPVQGADVLIVDEASMLDVRLAGALFGAVGAKTHVVLVGDPDQLAPVGPGRVLDDLLASEEVPVTRLTEVFRQAARSLIVRTAHAINEGNPPPREVPDDVVRDFFFIGARQGSEIFAEVVSLAVSRLPQHLGIDARADVQVLAPMHKGPVGIDAFNEALRAALNPDGQPIPGTALRVWDRVVQTRNDHERQLMNGEIGVIASYDREEAEAILATDDGRMLKLPLGAMDTLRLAHAMSVHKAQGSSAPAVIVPLFSGHRIMLTRNLVYTALTRAERMAVFVGEPAALDLALRRVDARRRHTRLAELVRA
jgi:ATP-dependent exoDNAse (exonuclease V) alpha subunit/intein/homing endonuclease